MPSTWPSSAKTAHGTANSVVTHGGRPEVARHARRRPAPTVWAPVEYACHVRDVCRIFQTRLQLMLTEADPQFPNWDQDQAAVDGEYPTQDPRQVVGELSAAAETVAAAFEKVSGDHWERTGTRSDGVQFTVRSFARYLLHDVAHHLYDVTGRRPH